MNEKVEHFGASASFKENFKQYGFTVENVVEKVKETIENNK
ncbi:hypothetical protein [uncultured Draconibacterium sp.]|nr:hypothetical protein [uncultured Draconibacterium sp.]